MSFAMNGSTKESLVEGHNCNIDKAVFDHGTGEKICSDCGIVLSVEREYADPLLDTNTKPGNKKLGTSVSPAHHDKNLSTMIPYPKGESDGVAKKIKQR